LIAERPYKRITEDDLKALEEGGWIVRAKVSPYRGPGHNPRVVIKEERIRLDDKSSGGFYVHSERGTNFTIDFEEMIEEKEESDGLTTTFWIVEDAKKEE